MPSSSAKQSSPIALPTLTAIRVSESGRRVVRDEAAVAWMVRPLPGAVNPTYYNGAPVGPDGCPIEEGGVISIGKTSSNSG